jgi:hypothetical protein
MGGDKWLQRLQRRCEGGGAARLLYVDDPGVFKHVIPAHNDAIPAPSHCPNFLSHPCMPF